MSEVKNSPDVEGPNAPKTTYRERLRLFKHLRKDSPAAESTDATPGLDAEQAHSPIGVGPSETDEAKSPWDGIPRPVSFSDAGFEFSDATVGAKPVQSTLDDRGVRGIPLARDAASTEFPSVKDFGPSVSTVDGARPTTDPAHSGFLRTLWGPIDTWVNSAAGYDERILAAHGTPTDEKRRRNIGRAIVVATLVGSLGWLVKISLAMPAPWGVVVGLVIAGLYGVLSYSLESFFASNVDVHAGLPSKLASLFGRSLLSGLIAFSGALPWVTMSLKGPIQLEMAKLGMQEQLAMREGIDKLHNVSALTSRGSALQTEMAQWSEALNTMPAPIQAKIDAADRCDAVLAPLVVDTPNRLAELNARLPVLAKMERSTSGAPVGAQRLAAVAAERKLIGARIAQANKALADKRSECGDLRKSASAARDDHVQTATEQRQSAQVRLAKQREAESVAFDQARADTAKADRATQAALSENSAGEFTALVSLLKTQTYALFIAGLIFLGLFMVDVLPLTLRLFSRPGPYDAEKRTDDAIRLMHAIGRERHADLIHDARLKEFENAAFRQDIQGAVRPQIRQMALDQVGGFLAKSR